ncbi:MAG: ABC transporter substrate-binding protein, partial [Alphaproteobacteria bacterium]
SLPYLLAMDFASILSAEYADKMMAAGTPEKLNDEPVGTGPYQLVQYQADALIRYVAHPRYWAGKAPLDNLVFLITPDAAVRVQRLRSGECQVIASPFPADIPALDNDPDIDVIRQTGADIGFLAFNTSKPPFNDTRVRAALLAAIDRETLVRAAYQGLGVMATGPIPPTFQAYEKSKPAYPYNPGWAKRILTEAGVVDLKTEIWALPVYRPYLPNARRVAEMIREDWLKVGVDAKIIVADWVEFLKLSMTGEHDTILFGWVGETGDPDNMLYPTLSCAAAKTGGNRARWCYEPFDSLLAHARTTADIAERTAIYREAQRLFREQAPWVPLAHSVAFTPIRKQVTGYRASPLGGHYFYGVDLR